MSKSLGNAIDPKEVYGRSGADVLRLWTATTDYSSDMPVSQEILSRVTEAYRRIRNTVRFLLGNTFDFDPATDAVPTGDMEEIDRWMLSRLQGLVERVTALMDRWLFYQALQAVQLFCTVDLSALYLDILKDRLYTYPPRSHGRRSAQTVLHELFIKVTEMVAPVLAHTAEEALWALPDGQRPAESVHLLPWPECEAEKVDKELEAKWEKLLEVRDEVYRRLEDARQEALVGTSLEAHIRVFAQGAILEALRQMEEQLPAFLIVSQVEVSDLSSFDGERRGSQDVEVVVERSIGEKCQRCWNYSSTIGLSEKHPDICERCAAALVEIEL